MSTRVSLDQEDHDWEDGSIPAGCIAFFSRTEEYLVVFHRYEAYGSIPIVIIATLSRFRRRFRL